jgi:hypothetical protein
MSKGWIVYWSVLLSTLLFAILRWAPTASIEAFAKVLGALSPIVTVGLAVYALFVWRVQLVGKRRYEIAEEALSCSQAVVYALEDIRNPAALDTEGSTREKSKTETEDQTFHLNRAFIPFERRRKYDDQFTDLAKSIVLAQTHYGTELADAMRVLQKAEESVARAARFVYRVSDPRMEKTKDQVRLIQERQAVIWQTREDTPDDKSNDDALSRKIDAAMATIERVCRAALVEPTFRDFFRIMR